jgi:hypothetical protein
MTDEVDHAAGLREWREYAVRHNCTGSGDKWAAFGDGFDRGVAHARAAEPSQPASVGGVGTLAWEMGYESGYDDREKMDHDRADVVKTENPFGEPIEPLHPTNEVESARDAVIAAAREVDEPPYGGMTEARAKLRVALSELERRLTVKT